MTLPDERSRSVNYTREFLYRLLDTKLTPRVPRSIRREAGRCLHHYPGTYDMVEAAKRAPDTFGKPDAR